MVHPSPNLARYALPLAAVDWWIIFYKLGWVAKSRSELSRFKLSVTLLRARDLIGARICKAELEGAGAGYCPL